ncbi:MAG: hypothetical protein RJA10_507 [Pseudomonadota bacterium]|jgi:hypothetical protein
MAVRLPPDTDGPALLHTRDRRRLAQRVSDAHRGIDDSTLMCFVSGSVVDGLADARSDVDMSVVMAQLPEKAVLERACQAAGGTPWFWSAGELGDQQLVVAFHVDDVEVQVAYASHAVLHDQLDELLRRHNPDTPLHKLAEGILKAEPLFSRQPLLALQQRLAAFPPALGLAMARHFIDTPPFPWRAMNQLIERDAVLWCRELQVQAGYRLLGLLAAVNGRYYTTFQNKRLRHFAAQLAISPPGLAERLEALLSAPPGPAARALHALEGEVLALVAQAFPGLDLAAVQARRAQFAGG